MIEDITMTGAIPEGDPFASSEPSIYYIHGAESPTCRPSVGDELRLVELIHPASSSAGPLLNSKTIQPMAKMAPCGTLSLYACLPNYGTLC